MKGVSFLPTFWSSFGAKRLIRNLPAESFDLTCGGSLSILERQAAKNKEAAP
jgi:hypothetical protein